MSELAASGPAITGAEATPGDGTAGAVTVTAVRAFNRFYTNTIGLLRGKYLDTAYSLTEARILFELAQRDASEAADLRRTVDIDTGYLSRILTRFESDGLISRQRSAADGRRQVIRLTEAGRHVVAGLTLAPRPRPATCWPRSLTRTGAGCWTPCGSSPTCYPGRRGRAGTCCGRPRRATWAGWCSGTGRCTPAEFGWDATYEALVARIVADYVDHRDPGCEAAWIAEVDGTRAGCVFCVRQNATTARLRLLLVEPWARGLGIGARLVEEVLRFARQAGYSAITSWTNDVLTDARRIYQRAGFTLDNESRHHGFGQDLTGQNWSRRL